MTTPTTGADRMRKDFESHMATLDYEGSWLNADTSGKYYCADVQAHWLVWQAAKQTPMVYDPTPRQSILTDEAVEAGAMVLETCHKSMDDAELASAIFHAMEAHLPAWRVVEAFRPLPKPGSQVASAMIDSLLAEYQWPSNTKNAGRAGWEAARRYLSTTAAGKASGDPAPGQEHSIHAGSSPIDSASAPAQAAATAAQPDPKQSA